VVELPLVVVQWTEAAGASSFPRVVVDLGSAAQLTVVERIGSADVDALSVPVVETEVADGAVLRWLSVQDLGRKVWQLGYHRSVLGSSASLLTAGIALGGDYARSRLDVDLLGEGATADMVAVYFSDGTQTHDFRTLQDHHGRKTSSDLLFKGAVAGEANAVYTGLIRVNPGAAGTSAYLTNRNIVLSEGARVDSVPNLDIVRESDVKQCGHASASGPIDEDQRFYLESRGVPTDVAERLIVMGFFEDVFRRLPVPALLSGLHDAVAAKLTAVVS
jgi:Fe-S cluster assembly protein SufD